MMRDRGEGRVYRRGRMWWLGYYVTKDGKNSQVREPAYLVERGKRRRATNEKEALRALKLRRAEVAVARAGFQRFRGPAQERVLFGQLLDSVEREATNLKSKVSLRSRVTRLRSRFGDYRALAITPDLIEDFRQERKAQGAAPATINRELEVVRHAFRIARDEGRLAYEPRVRMCTVRNVRTGFLNRADFTALVGAIEDADLRDFTEFAWVTAMRKGEIASLKWASYDRDGKSLALEAADAKSGHSRTLALVGVLGTILDRRVAERRLDCPFIFHRDGHPVGEFRRAWRTATRTAGLEGVLFHDLRRSGIRNLVRAGVDIAVAMKISGHRTRSTFDRYNVTSADDIADALLRTEGYLAEQPASRKIQPIGAR